MDGEINIIDLVFVLLKKWVVIIITMSIFALLFYGYTKLFVPPMYESRSSLYVSNTKNTSTGALYQNDSDISLSNLLTSQEMLKTCMEILRTDRFYERVKSVSGLNYSARALKGMVSMEQKNETNVLQVSVTAPDPDTAYILLETFLASATDEVEWIIEGGSIKVIDHATYSTSPISKGLRKKAIMGAILGFILSAAIILMLEFLDTKVKSSSDLVKYNLYILSEIPSATINIDA